MKVKALLITSLLIALVGCSKDEPEVEDWGWWDPFSSMITSLQTPKGMVPIALVSKEALPTWLQAMTEDIERGYIMKAAKDEALLYFVYDYGTNYGCHYDSQGNATKDNPKLKDWTIIYVWNPNNQIYYW